MVIDHILGCPWKLVTIGSKLGYYNSPTYPGRIQKPTFIGVSYNPLILSTSRTWQNVFYKGAMFKKESLGAIFQPHQFSGDTVDGSEIR